MGDLPGVTFVDGVPVVSQERLCEIMMDACHMDLICGLVASLKPSRVLELGVGSGVLTRRILQTLTNYGLNDSQLTCVDNFSDFGGKCPAHLGGFPGFDSRVCDFPGFDSRVSLCVMGELEFLMALRRACGFEIGPLQVYDLIVSDADHNNTHLWMDKTLEILNPGGILIYHDVLNSDFPNLRSLITQAGEKGLSHFVFSRNSVPSERCDRGLLVIRKEGCDCAGVHEID